MSPHSIVLFSGYAVIFTIGIIWLSSIRRTGGKE